MMDIEVSQWFPVHIITPTVKVVVYVHIIGNYKYVVIINDDTEGLIRCFSSLEDERFEYVSHQHWWDEATAYGPVQHVAMVSTYDFKGELPNNFRLDRIVHGDVLIDILSTSDEHIVNHYCVRPGHTLTSIIRTVLQNDCFALVCQYMAPYRTPRIW